MWSRIHYLSVFLVFACSSVVKANDVRDFQQQALQGKLYQQEQWRDLLHFDDSKSYVDDPAFFLSQQGQADPKAELLATIASLAEDAELACRFPARRYWLMQQLPGFLAQQATPLCKEYQQWRKKVNAHSVTLVLASSYLNSPSSMYGHTFLRFDPEQQGEGVSLVSYAVNFGALVDNSDSGMFYAFKGLVGGYPGYFSDGPYYEKVKEYSRLDNRDVWEYKLNLTPQEVDFMLSHLWELKDIRFDYFFFDENCSFRLLELLEVARPDVHLVEDFPVYAIPVDTVRSVQQADMVDSVFYRASNKSKLSFNIESLAPDDRALALALANDGSVLQSQDYQQLPEVRQYRVTEVAYQYLRFRENRRVRSKQTANLSFVLLKEMKRLSAYANHKAHDDKALPVPPRPEQGHETAMTSLTVGMEDDLLYTQWELRASYHDVLDNLYAYPESVSLNIGKLAIRAREHDDAKLQYLDLIEITSVSVRDDFFKPISWRVKAGLERQWTAGYDKLVSQVSGGGGWTHQLWGNLNSFAFIYGRLEYNSEKDTTLDAALGADIGLLLQSDKGSFMAEALQYRFTDGEERMAFKATYQLPLAVNHGLRFAFTRHWLNDVNYNESALSYRYYF